MFNKTDREIDEEILSLKSQRESDIENAQYEFYHPKANKPLKQNNNSEDQTNNNPKFAS